MSSAKQPLPVSSRKSSLRRTGCPIPVPLTVARIRFSHSPLTAAPLLCLPTHHVVATWTGNWAWIKHIEEEIERISIADFEADCLRLPDQIVRQRRVIIITKQDKPIADGGGIDIFGRMAGTATICGDLISPIEDAGWTGNKANI